MCGVKYSRSHVLHPVSGVSQFMACCATVIASYANTRIPHDRVTACSSVRINIRAMYVTLPPYAAE